MDSVENDDTMMAEYVSEMNEHLQLAEQLLLEIEDGHTEEGINALFRSVHSVKGASSFFNHQNVASISHYAEYILNTFRTESPNITREVIDLLLQSVEILSELINSEDYGVSEDVSPLIADLKTCSESIEKSEGKVELPNENENVEVAFESDVFTEDDVNRALENYGGSGSVFALQVNANVLNGDSFKNYYNTIVENLKDAAKLLGHTFDAAEIDAVTLPVVLFFETSLDADCLSVFTDIDMSYITKLDVGSEAISEDEKERVSSDSEKPPCAAEGKSAVAKSKNEEASPAKKSVAPARKSAPPAKNKKEKEAHSIRIPVNVLDELLELIGGVVLGRNQFIDRFEGDSAFKNFSQGITKLHQHVIKIRMQPVETLFNKFKRTVRDLSRALGKQVTLKIEGGEIELDRTILEALSDPLNHLIRNSIDHGMETSDERTEIGKPAIGTVTLRAYHESGQIIFEVQDDGKGINSEIIKVKALEAGLISNEEAELMNENELNALIFHPGFSTKEEVSEISGRGVGMDVVKTNLEKMGCIVELRSRVNVGTTVMGRIPLTEAIVNSSVISALVIKIANYTLALPQVTVNEIVKISAENQMNSIESINGREVFKLRNMVIPLVYLEDILGVPRTYIDPITSEERIERREHIMDRRAEENGKRFDDHRVSEEPRRIFNMIFIVLQYKQNYFGVLVDQIVGTEEIVVKKLPAVLKQRKVFGGSTVLGDGTISFILSINDMVEKAGLNFERQEKTHSLNISHGAHQKEAIQRLIVFTNAAEEYFAIPVNLLSEVDRFSKENIKKVGKKEYLQRKDKSIPLLRLDSILDVNKIEDDVDDFTVLVPARTQYPMGIIASSLVATIELHDDVDAIDADERGVMGTFIYKNTLVTLLDVFSLLHYSEPERYADLVGDDLLKCRVLLAEDQPFFRQLVSQYFKSFGIKSIDVACDGAEALEKLSKNPDAYDLVVSDIEMPNMNGYQLVSNIRLDPALKHLPVMALTTLAGEENVAKGYDAGFDAYEIKIDKEQVIKSLGQLYKKSLQTNKEGVK